MLPIAERIIEEARKKAEEIVREARELEKIMIQEAEEERKARIREALEEERKEIEMEARAERARIIMNARREIMKKEREIFERVVEKAKELLRENPERLFELCVKKAGGFRNPEILIGKRYARIAERLGIKGKLADIDGIRIGENGVWINGEISDNVDEVVEKRIGEIMELIFGERR